MSLGIVLVYGPMGWRFLMSEVPLYAHRHPPHTHRTSYVQGHLDHKKTPTPLGLP